MIKKAVKAAETEQKSGLSEWDLGDISDIVYDSGKLTTGEIHDARDEITGYLDSLSAKYHDIKDELSSLDTFLWYIVAFGMLEAFVIVAVVLWG